MRLRYCGLASKKAAWAMAAAQLRALRLRPLPSRRKCADRVAPERQTSSPRRGLPCCGSSDRPSPCRRRRSRRSLGRRPCGSRLQRRCGWPRRGSSAACPGLRRGGRFFSWVYLRESGFGRTRPSAIQAYRIFATRSREVGWTLPPRPVGGGECGIRTYAPILLLHNRYSQRAFTANAAPLRRPIVAARRRR